MSSSSNSASYATPKTTVVRTPAMTALFEPLTPAPYHRTSVPAPRAMIANSATVGTSASRQPLSPCTTLHGLSRFPMEVRLVIWAAMLPGPRLVLDRSFGSMSWDQVAILQIQWAYDTKHFNIIPVNLHVCAESRAECLKIYQRIGRQYMNLSLDTLWFPYTSIVTNKQLFGTFRNPVACIQSIMIEGTNLFKRRVSLDDEHTLRIIDFPSIMNLLPNHTEIIVKVPFEIPSNQKQECWDFITSGDKFTVFDSRAVKNEPLATEDVEVSAMQKMVQYYKAGEIGSGEIGSGKDGVKVKFLTGTASFTRTLSVD